MNPFLIPLLLLFNTQVASRVSEHKDIMVPGSGQKGSLEVESKEQRSKKLFRVKNIQRKEISVFRDGRIRERNLNERRKTSDRI